MKERTGVIIVALLAVLGLGLVAATVTTTITTQYDPGIGDSSNGWQDPVFGSPDDGEVHNDSRNATRDGAERTRPVNLPEICVPTLTNSGVIIGIVATLLLLVAVGYRAFGLLGAAFTIYLVCFPTTIAYALMTQCASSSTGPGNPDWGGNVTGPDPGGPGASGTISPAVVVALFAVAIIGAVVMILSQSGDDDGTGDELLDENESDISSIRNIAGESADRIEANNEDRSSNVVYEAWSEMTTALGGDDSTTPEEFIDRAVGAGVGEEEARELTQLFEDVRYGNVDPEMHEDRALEVLRRIEEG